MPVGLLLSATGGFLDAYTYVRYGRVFANAQTGTVVLLAIGLVRGEFAEALHHLPPVALTGIVVQTRRRERAS